MGDRRKSLGCGFCGKEHGKKEAFRNDEKKMGKQEIKKKRKKGKK